MKIAVISDLHLGYARFEEDSYAQAALAVSEASARADLILCAGDIFDVKIPKLETLKRAVEMFRKAGAPVFAIHGNHERRARDMVNPVQLLASGTGVRLLHGESAIFEKEGERVQVFGMGSVPDEYAAEALAKALGRFRKEDGAFAILMLHQTIRELVPSGKDELSLDDLERLPFDLIVDGHIHETSTKLGGRFLIPGSTIITQLKKEETAPRGFFLYDTKARKAEFVPIASRRFFYEELAFLDAGEADVRAKVDEAVARIRAGHPRAIIAIKLDGTLKAGLAGADIRTAGYEDVFIDNRLDAKSLQAKLDRIRSGREARLSLRDMALRELGEKTKGKITMFEPAELFEKLAAGADGAMEYLERHNKKDER
jgi:predicted phosphodiesterase